MIRINRIQIRNYRGVRDLDACTPNGAIARGKNGSGKTSVLNAIGAALGAEDIGGDALRLGADKGEVLIEVDVDGKPLLVSRRFTAAGSSLTLKTGDGDTKARPATVLAELLGSAPLDVVGVVLEQDKKKRRALVLQALPCKVTVEQMRQWVPGLEDRADVSGHGLEVVARFREGAKSRRKAANALVVEAKRKATDAKARADEARFVIEGRTCPDFAEASREVEHTNEALSTLRARVRAINETLAKSATTTEQVKRLREEATEARRTASLGSNEDDVRTARFAHEDALVTVERCRAALREAEGAAAAAKRELDAHADSHKVAREDADRAVARDQAADALEASLASLTTPVPESDIEAALDAARRAQERLTLARAKSTADELAAEHTRAAEALATAEGDAAKYDRIVQALTNEAPAALLASAQAPAGLELSGDDVLLDGVSLDKLCGAEQMQFAASIARALNPGVGFLVVDGLERLDPEQLDAFVSAATADGRQLFGSLVDRGELVLAAIGHSTGEERAA